MHYIFLIINLFLVVIPFCLLLNKSVFKLKALQSAILPAVITAVVFSTIGALLIYLNVFNFNNSFLINVFIGALPIEYCLFSFSFSFVAICFYNYLNSLFLNNNLQKFSLSVSNLLLGVCIAILFFSYAKWYPAITFSLLLLLLFYIEYVNKLRFMYRFYRAFFLCLILFYACYGLLCNLPIIQYNANQTMVLKIYAIPLESHFFTLLMCLFAVYLLELFKSKTAK